MAAHTQKNNKPSKPEGKEAQPLIIAKTPAEEQRLKLERLMRNPDKPAPIPDRPKEWNPRAPPEFVRDVMGSSAGAGSGEFHVYRHLRRREYQRQDFLDKMAELQNKDDDYLEKLEINKQAAEERTAKRRKKREKLKQKKLMAKKAKIEAKNSKGDAEKSTENSEEEEEEEEKEEKDEEREAEDDAEAPSFIMGKK
ncbi:PRKR-interacting protein 1 -like protein [Channa argus]|uniref:PRKR-interacting protein 1-like protein n=1 Tax=Channa argus TaxID=215402 RepID=A0A6G1QJ84_CHAAH|nr:PRKR-interacting protein 1 -like protein [Channa argus]